MIKKLLCKLGREDDGAVAVEFGLTLPVFVGMISLIIEGSLMLFTFGTVNYAAEQATRYAIVNYDATADDIKAIAREELKLLNPTDLEAIPIVVANPFTDDEEDDNTRLVTITISFSYEPIFPFIETFFGKEESGSGITISAASKGFIVEEIDSELYDEADDEEEVV